MESPKAGVFSGVNGVEKRRGYTAPNLKAGGGCGSEHALHDCIALHKAVVKRGADMTANQCP